MRAPIIALSLVGAVAIFLLGGFLNAITGIGFDVASPYNDPFRVVATFFGAAPGFVIALTGLGFALYDAARRNGLGWFITLLAWPFIPLLAASLMFAGALAYPESWFLLLALVPLAPLLYGITAPAAVTASPGTARVTASVAPAAPPATPTLNTPEMSAPATLPPSPTLPPPPAPRILSPSGMSLAASWRRLAVFVGVLAAVVVGGTLLLFPSPPASTGGQSGPPALQVTQASASADCASGTYPPVTLTNTGSQTLQWTAKSEDSNVTAIPSQGTIAPGAVVTVSLSGKTTAPDIIVQFAAGTGGGGGVVKFGCQPGTGK